ncbi:MAG: penicillin-insensitive murein endopeptidase [Rhodospirillales bacterium]|nr:penicillin-insensitive murein endopeptidase [Rhodospirillales bacterium]
MHSAPCIALAAAFLYFAGLAAIARPAQAVGFSDVTTPSEPPAQVFGGHAKGCVAGSEALPLEGDGWQVMRPSRNRFWGHPTLVAFIENFAGSARAAGWPGLLIGDLAQPRGGPMSSGHRSHQTGLDVDIWFLPAPPQALSRSDREGLSAVSMVAEGGTTLSPAWGDGYAWLLQTAAQYPEVDRIFVNPAIKQALCDTTTGDRTWLAKLRPWWGHDAHFHVGLHCPAGDGECVERPAIPPGDGCDASLAWWFSAEAREQLRTATPTPRPTLDDLPTACRGVLFGG